MAKIFYLDPGHGGHDPGATGHSLKEKDIVMDVCERAQKYLNQHYEADCRLTRSDDRFLELRQRTAMARTAKAHCIVSVHVNSATTTSANGFESFIHPDDATNSESAKLQSAVHKRLAKVWTSEGRRDRGQKVANFHMVREYKPSVLIELGFIVNGPDAALLKKSAFLERNAQALAEGVADFLRLNKRKATPPSGKVYRVLIDGAQVGAYADPKNVARQVSQAVAAGKERVEVALIK
jgi:N-acetylmuramoyl-L-alanine amidase